MPFCIVRNVLTQRIEIGSDGRNLLKTSRFKEQRARFLEALRSQALERQSGFAGTSDGETRLD